MQTLRFAFLLFVPALLVCVMGAMDDGPPRWQVGLRSFGPVRFGMTLPEASRVLGEELKPGEEYAAEGCSYISPRSIPPGTAFMVINGRVERADIDTTGISTISGVHVGSSEDDVHRLYPGQVRVEPHPYDGPEWHYLIFTPRDPADSGFGIIFETDGHVVKSYRAGRRPAVSYIEGCA